MVSNHKLYILKKEARRRRKKYFLKRRKKIPYFVKFNNVL